MELKKDCAVFKCGAQFYIVKEIPHQEFMKECAGADFDQIKSIHVRENTEREKDELQAVLRTLHSPRTDEKPKRQPKVVKAKSARLQPRD
jgi:hypothetical protein